MSCLDEAARTAHFLGCPLVTLHTPGRTSAHEAASHFGESINLIAIDVPESARLRLPGLDTTRLLAGTMFERRTDVSTKRNLALLLSHMLRWKRVVFLDDDIRVPDPSDLSRAASLLDTHTAVGLGIGGFPDNSMVCHAYREIGGWQDTFIGGGALAVDIRRNRSFFPNIYNEDWFFVLDAGKGLQSVATVGRVFQAPYDPYRPERAKAEEFGDVLAEGTFWLLDQDKSASDGDLAHWRDFLTKRKRFIRRVLDMIECAAAIEPAERERRAEALNAALGRLARITPELCVDYLKALAVDQERWQRHIQAIRRQPKPRRELALESLARVGGTPLTWCSIRASSPKEPVATRRHRAIVTAKRSWRAVTIRELQSRIALPPALARAAHILRRETGIAVVPRVRVASSPAAHALVAAEIALAGEKGQAEGDGLGR